MRINEFEYHDKDRGWKLERTKFSDLTLLVGISGVGKTEILKAIGNVRAIAEGESFSGVKWDIVFSTNDNKEYRWMGEFEKRTDDSGYSGIENSEKKKASLLHEKLLDGNENIIIERDGKDIVFNNEKTPKLPPYVSTIYTLKEEDDISPVYKNLRMIYIHNKELMLAVAFSDKKLKALLKNKRIRLEEIANYDLPIIIKFLLVSRLSKKTYAHIKKRFTDLFPNTKDIRVKIEQAKSGIFEELSIEETSFQIKEKGVDNWISFDRISMGMLKTLHLICEMYLQPEGTVNLIDEFENSLGINCINILEDGLYSERKIQYIITSHHPYIINKIGKEHWKLVTRKGGTVTARDAEEFLNVKSHHEAFIRLINLPEYKEGIETT
ncbi:MAG: AAA family ATPase [Candidatus Magnetobacterium sp. LHC-1]